MPTASQVLLLMYNRSESTKQLEDVIDDVVWEAGEFLIVCYRGSGRRGVVTGPISPRNRRREILDIFTVEIASPDGTQFCEFVRSHAVDTLSIVGYQG